jgi:hypothetical protein
MANNNPTFVVTGKVRFSYAHVFKPYVNPRNPGQEAKYSVTILLPKSDTATKARIDAAIEAAKQLGAQTKWGGQIPPNVAICVHDGDGVKPSDGLPFGPECKGHWVFTASSTQAPQVVDATLNPIIDQSQVYSGCYGRVSVNFFPYFNSGRKGIGCGLGNVQKLEDGEPLGGRTTAMDDFGDQMAGPYGPVYVAQPVQQQPLPYQQPVQPMQQPLQQLNPITGQPLPPGGVYGINQ